MIDNDLLLFIEPEGEPSKLPLIDRITKKMVYRYRRGLKGLEVNKLCKNKDPHMIVEMPWNPKYNFVLYNYYMGVHQCSCGSLSGSRNFLIQTGDIVNSLCVHYLAFHRDEVPHEQLEKIKAWSLSKKDDIYYPTDEELAWPPRIEVAEPLTRQEYLEKNS